MKYVYYYNDNKDDIEYGLYTEITEPAYLDELKTAKQGQDVYFCPENATLTVPPETPENKRAKITDTGSWSLVTYYRHKFVCDKDLNISEVDYIGEIKEGYVLLTDEERAKIQSDKLYYVVKDGELVENPNYEAEKAALEAERIARLYLTAADVERAIYKAKGMDFDDIIELVEAQAPEGLDVKALKIELKANNFYRGNPYIDTIGTLLGLTSEQLDKFFETNDYKDLCPSRK